MKIFLTDVLLGSVSAVIFSETDGEEEESQSEQESCFPSPKMKKFSGLFSSDTPGKR